MSLLQDTPVTPARPDLAKYVLPGLVLLNLLLLASLAGWMPVVFGDQPDPARMARQIDADRVKVVPASAADTGDTDKPGQSGQAGRQGGRS
ncbi:MAG: hypothetical protein Q4E06_07905 [Lautropia sp.]|nr:hypothetical protein [Lautropia sp.]